MFDRVMHTPQQQMLKAKTKFGSFGIDFSKANNKSVTSQAFLFGTFSPNLAPCHFSGQTQDVCHHPEKFGDHGHFHRGDLMFLICNVMSRAYMFKVFIWLYGWKHLSVSHYLAMFGRSWSSTCGDKMYLTSHVALRNQVIEKSCEFVSGNSSLCVTILKSLIARGIVLVEI